MGLLMGTSFRAALLTALGAVALSACQGDLSQANADPAVIQAILGNDVERLERLLQAGASPNAKVNGLMPLALFAIDQDRCEAVSVLLRYGASYNYRWGPAQRAPLHEAALDGRTVCVRELLEAGANPNIRNAFGRTPLHYATTPEPPLEKPPNSDEIVALLIQHGAQP